MRDYLYTLLTTLSVTMSTYLDNKIYWFLLRLWDWYYQVAGWRDQMNQMVSTWVIGWPSFIGDIVIRIMSLATNYIISPISGVIQAVLRLGITAVGDLYSAPSQLYLPSYWLKWLILNFRDRVINVIDDTASLITATHTWVTTQVNALHTLLQPWIDDVTTWRGDISRWIGQNIYNPLQTAISDITDLGTAVGSLVDNLHLITQDPVAWIWNNLSPYLRQKLSDWLNAIWYTRI